MNRTSQFFQVILGIFLGTLLVAGALGGFVYFLWTKFTISPSRPIFVEEKKPKKIAKKIKNSSPSVAEASPSPSVAQASPSPSVTMASPSPSPSPEATSSSEELPKGAYKAIVHRAEGLSLRSGPSRASERVGGVSNRERVIVLEKTEDGEWSKIRSTASNIEGWVRSGNLRTIEEEVH